jgi:hypothetical protein
VEHPDEDGQLLSINLAVTGEEALELRAGARTAAVEIGEPERLAGQTQIGSKPVGVHTGEAHGLPPLGVWERVLYFRFVGEA